MLWVVKGVLQLRQVSCFTRAVPSHELRLRAEGCILLLQLGSTNDDHGKVDGEAVQRACAAMCVQ